MVVKTAIAAGLLGGGLVLGSLVTFNGGATLDAAKTKITQQASALNIFKTQQSTLVETLQTKKAELAKLKAEGTAEDQATIDKLTADIATIQANVDAGSEDVANRINDLEAEVNEANEGTAQLQTVVDTTGAVPSTLTQRQMDELTDNMPTDAIILAMMNDTPQLVPNTDNKLTIDKTSADTATAHLKLINSDSLAWFVTIDGGEEIGVGAGTQIDLGLVTDLDGAILDIHKAGSVSTAKYYLSAE